MTAYVIEPTKDGKWQIREVGTDRVISVHDTSAEARQKLKELSPTRPSTEGGGGP